MKKTALDHSMVIKKQKAAPSTIRRSIAMRKYILGQIALKWLLEEDQPMRYMGMSANRLYASLARYGYRWNEKEKVWEPKK